MGVVFSWTMVWDGPEVPDVDGPDVADGPDDWAYGLAGKAVN